MRSLRVFRGLFFISALACASILMASRGTTPAAACPTLTFTATCHNANPSYVSFGGCYYGDCASGSNVAIYAGCDSTCGNCGNFGLPEVFETTVDNSTCNGDMSGSYNVTCSSPNQGYVCAYDEASKQFAPAVYVGSCDCIESPTR